MFCDVINIPEKNKYTNVEIYKYILLIEEKYLNKLDHIFIDQLKEYWQSQKRTNLINIIVYINGLIKSYKIKKIKLCHSGKKRENMLEQLISFIDSNKNSHGLITELYNNLLINNINTNDNITYKIKQNITDIKSDQTVLKTYMHNITNTLNAGVHGHKNAKKQIERIIGQWLNGEQSGYCFGFEGPPGIGKTSLAKKGLTQCLKDNNGENRPFAFIAMGGSTNGSVLDGHNYTYVGSTWGRIVDILMEKKCMNPIIFIDELDKVSRTEQGKEIIGILTHLIDGTQNNEFQDKYFSGVGLDLSKALFIFSYNDVEAIDTILLDRIHRIKFDHLSLEDKLVISRDYLLPEIFDKMGLQDLIEITDDILEFLINTYTVEPGVRKLKELLFEIIGEINLQLLQTHTDICLPFKLTIDDIKYNYLKDRHEIKEKKIHAKPLIGTINGLWANSMGRGGVIPIEVRFISNTTFLGLKLTGMQGDVMKESMSVATTLAWNRTDSIIKNKLLKEEEETKNLHGIHIHCPEGAVPKDGPSAGTAITSAIFSLLNNKK